MGLREREPDLSVGAVAPARNAAVLEECARVTAPDGEVPHRRKRHLVPRAAILGRRARPVERGESPAEHLAGARQRARGARPDAEADRAVHICDGGRPWDMALACDTTQRVRGPPAEDLPSLGPRTRHLIATCDLL